MIMICNKCKGIFATKNGDVIDPCDCSDNTFWDCDEDMVPILQTLWDKGYDTRFSCSGHSVLKHYDNESNDVVGYILRPEYDVYVVIENVHNPKELVKYKYGAAYIEECSAAKLYKNEMINYGIELPDDYIVTSSDPIFLTYLNEVYSKEEQEDVINLMKINSLDFRISVNASRHPMSYIDKYRHLLELRSDVAKLVDLLPLNK